MLATSITAAVFGVDAHLVRVEADSAPGFPRFTMVGLADSAVKESESRIRAALRNCGIPFKWDRRITVNLAPAGLRKYGSSFDLATAVGLLAADGGFAFCVTCADVLLVGEVALDGGLRPGGRRSPDAAPGASPRPGRGHRPLRQPPGGGSRPWSARVRRLHAAGGAHPSWRRTICPRPLPRPSPPRTAGSPRAASPTSAARPWRAGRSRSPPPEGTTSCSSALRARARRCSPGGCRAVLPPLTFEEALETTAIHSAAGLPAGTAWSTAGRSAARTTRSATSRSSAAARPRARARSAWPTTACSSWTSCRSSGGAILEVLRQPLEEGHVTIARHRRHLRIPCSFQLVAAMNPCPCGRRPAPEPAAARRRRSVLPGRLSGPLLDRIDLHRPGSCRGLPLQAFGSLPRGEPSASVARRVLCLRVSVNAGTRRRRTPTLNALLEGETLRQPRRQSSDAWRLLERAAWTRFGWSAGVFDRVLKVSRTVADLEGRRPRWSRPTQPKPWASGWARDPTSRFEPMVLDSLHSCDRVSRSARRPGAILLVYRPTSYPECRDATPSVCLPIVQPASCAG